MKILNKLIISFFVFLFLFFCFPVNTLADTTTDPAVEIIGTIFPGLGLVVKGASIVAPVAACLLSDPIGCISDAIMQAAIIMAEQISKVFLDMSIETLKISTNPQLLGIGFTPSDNTYVSSGWGIVKNLANAALVIGLVFIAISIILGKEENKAKKTLINFIIIALLINFTPVICGFIIDGSNIVTSSLLTGGIDSSYSVSISNAFASIANDKSLTVEMQFTKTIVLFIFSLFAIVIFFLYAILFFARVVILQILVIISPIAFATKVFPQSKYIKKVFPSVLYWDDWWESFVQWCVIGIPAGMSIYLSNKMMVDYSAAVAKATDPVFGLIDYIIPFIFLIAGFMITISAGGQVGSFVGGLATGAWAASGGRAIKGATEAAKKGGDWMIEGGERTAAGFAVGGLSGIKQGYNDAGIKGAVIGGATGAAMGGIGAEGREKAAKKIAEIKESVGFTKRGEYDAKLGGDIEEAQKRLDNLSDDDLRKITTSGAETRGANIEKSAAFNALNKKGKMGDSEIDYLAANKKWAETFGVKLKDVSKARPEHAQKLIGKSAYDMVSGMSPAEAGKTINSKSFANTEVLSSLNKKTLAGKLDKGTAEDIKNIRDGFTGMLQNMNTFSGTVVLQEDLEKLVGGNMKDISVETDKMINSGIPEEIRKGTAIRGLVNALNQKRL